MSWLWAVPSVAGLYALHRFALWAETRGWIYYWRKRGSPGSSAQAFLEIQSMLETNKKHAIEAMREEDDEQDDAGGPLKP